jgi:hypothetical protein
MHRRGERKALPLPGPDPFTVQPVAIRYTDCCISLHPVDNVITNSSVTKPLKDDLNVGIGILISFPATSETDLARPIQHNIHFFFSGVRLSPLGTAATSGLLYQPQMRDEGDCGAIG